jgi:2-dehydro-3-deoxygluconokinase
VTGPPASVVAFGELLLRLSPHGHTRIVQAEAFEARYTGAEANVAVALSCFGLGCSVVSKVPEGELGQACVNYVRRFGVDTSHVRRGGERLGTLYLETGAAPRATKVVYDRAGSAFALSRPSDYDWTAILDGKQWLHFSGTAPSGGAGVAEALRCGVRMARNLGMTVSCDLNYRSKLWGAEEAGAALAPLMPFVDVLTGSGEDAARVFGISPRPGDLDSDGLTLDGHRYVAAVLTERFGIARVAGTLRRPTSPRSSGITGVLCHGEAVATSRSYEIGTVVDRVGAGDAFSAGVIFGLLEKWDAQHTVEFAAAGCCLKHSIEGDFGLLTRQEVEAVSSGAGNPRIER